MQNPFIATVGQTHHSLAFYRAQREVSAVYLCAIILSHCDVTDVSHASNNLQQ